MKDYTFYPEFIHTTARLVMVNYMWPHTDATFIHISTRHHKCLAQGHNIQTEMEQDLSFQPFGYWTTLFTF